MSDIQQELSQSYPGLRIQLLGVNEPGQEAGNGSMTDGRDLPWLQDVDSDQNGQADVWYDLWDVTFRDVVILDGQNVKVGVYNVTVHNLAEPAFYAELKQMLVDAAMDTQKPWLNHEDPVDVDDSGFISPLDALLIINRINLEGSQHLPPPTTETFEPPYFDCNGDNDVTPSDVLQVINFLNGHTGAAGEGEAGPECLIGQVPPSSTLAEPDDVLQSTGSSQATSGATLAADPDDAQRSTEASVGRGLRRQDVFSDDRVDWMPWPSVEWDAIGGLVPAPRGVPLL